MLSFKLTAEQARAIRRAARARGLRTGAYIRDVLLADAAPHRGNGMRLEAPKLP